ncbi:DUF6380 family protein [Streptomyces sp. FXJ1.172]|uniref:DUF6380 family protein n=1 Tax=Streptomyces sp. FXJ1.172 TaxID=710705 RepID=UPI002F401215
MDLTEPGDMGEATLHCGVASQTATAGRAPFTLHAGQACGAPKGRGAVPDMRLPPRGHDQPRRARARSTARHGTPCGALGHAWKDAR